MALNAPIQGSAADIIKVAMLNVQRAISGMRSRMLLQVHDELVFEVHPGELDDLRQVVVKEMAAAYELTVPLDVSVGVGSNWEDAGHRRTKPLLPVRLRLAGTARRLRPSPHPAPTGRATSPRHDPGPTGCTPAAGRRGPLSAPAAERMVRRCGEIAVFVGNPLVMDRDLCGAFASFWRVITAKVG